MDDPRTALRILERARLSPSSAEPARIETEIGALTVAAHAPGVLRLRLGSASGADYGLIGPAASMSAPRASERDGAIFIEAGDFRVRADAAPLRVEIAHGDRVVLRSTTDGHIRGGLRVPPFAAASGRTRAAFALASGRTRAAFALASGEAVYGLGEKYGPLNRRGQLVTSWNEDALGVNAERSYKNVPFAWSPSGWGIFVNTTARVRHAVGYPQWSLRSYIVEVEEPSLDLFVIAGASPAEMLQRFTALTGRTPPLPRWSFGVWMSRAYYRTEAEAIAVAREIRARQIPCDVFTLDGRAWLKVDTRFGFAWDEERYPDPAAFAAELRGLDLRLCLWEYPYISIRNPLFATLAERGYLLKTASGEPYVFYWDPAPFGTLLTPLPASGMVDFTNPDAYAWYRDAHKPLFDVGADVMKSDFGEQIPADAVAFNGDTGARLHNAYALLYNRCVYEATARYHEGEPLVWARSGWTGSQTVPLQWGGDPQTDWEGLAGSIRGGLSWGLSGAPFYSHDIGGFYGPPPDAELYVRWLQAGVLSSHTRFHGTSPREPWMFGEAVERVAKAWLAWRYRLIPYLESCADEAARTGLPVMRAMPLAFPHDPAAWSYEEQYLLGPSLLIAPIVRPGGDVNVYLPSGAWYEVSSGERLVGPMSLARTMPLDEVPVYAREGAILPLGPAVQHTGALGPSPHLDEVRVYGLPDREVTWRNAAIAVRRTSAGVWLRGLPGGVRVRTRDATIVETPEEGVIVRWTPGADDDRTVTR